MRRAPRRPVAARDACPRRVVPSLHDAILACQVFDAPRRLALVAGSPLAVKGDRGYSFAEATAGGVALEEVRWKTMESRKADGLYLVGEVLDVDGRIGGFNFQWAWSTGYIAGRAAAGAAA